MRGEQSDFRFGQRDGVTRVVSRVMAVWGTRAGNLGQLCRVVLFREVPVPAGNPVIQEKMKNLAKTGSG